MSAAHKAIHIVVWVFSVLLCLAFLMAGVPKLLGPENIVRQFASWGYPDWFRIVVGVVEVCAAVLLLVPRLAHVGAAAIVVIMAGATYTHAIRVPEEAGRAPFTLTLLAIAALIGYARYRDTSRAPSAGRRTPAAV